MQYVWSGKLPVLSHLLYDLSSIAGSREPSLPPWDLMILVGLKCV